MVHTNEEKFFKWNANAAKGESGFSRIIRDRERWYYNGGGTIEPITSLTVAIQKGTRFYPFYEWDKTQTDFSRRFVIVTKDDKKLMIHDETEGFITFGLSESDDAAEKILILFSTENVNSVIVASQDAPQMDVRHHYQDYQDVQRDLLQECVRQLFHPIVETTSMESEVKQHVFSDEQFGNESGTEQE